MRKIIDIDDKIIPKLKLLAALEDSSVKKVMENAIAWYVEHKQNQQVQAMSVEQKEDLGLLLLMQQVDMSSMVDEDELFKQ
ncbi:hypothetical protein [Aquimarina sp. AU474]|uniref:hypothetical protein n=1 Tax=Aquimarina sp. AU474 TaxID=2108529 RepID=UPI000D68FED5|nr:hypothetical protein [Aquimarina sp. AU474]